MVLIREDQAAPVPLERASLMRAELATEVTLAASPTTVPLHLLPAPAESATSTKVAPAVVAIHASFPTKPRPLFKHWTAEYSSVYQEPNGKSSVMKEKNCGRNFVSAFEERM